MSVDRTARRLTRCYPMSWRTRYGEELESLIVDMSGGRRVPLRAQVNVMSAGIRERLRCMRAADQPPERRVRSGLAAGLWAWAVFMLAGMIVQKTSEHWEEALPAGGAPLARVAFASLTGISIFAGLLVLGGLVSSAPAFVGFLRGGGWAHLRSRAFAAGVATAALLVASVALIVWSHGLTGRQRDGHDLGYAVGFLAWAGLGAGCLLAWTSVAARAARSVELSRARLRAQTRIVVAVSAAMAVMAAATAAWWIAVAHTTPSALTGGSTYAHTSALVPQLIVAMLLMVLACTLAVLGARRACAALREVR